MIRIAIFASGEGTNAENIIRFFQSEETVTVSLVLYNRREAGVAHRAEQLDIPVIYVPKEAWTTGESIMEHLQAAHIDLIVLAGFLLRVPKRILQAYPEHILNIHPALLPKFGGKGMYGDKVHKAVLAAGETQSGITIHVVSESYDEGRILQQQTCPILYIDTATDIAHRIHQLEYHFYPRVILQYCNEFLSLNNKDDAN